MVKVVHYSKEYEKQWSDFVDNSQHSSIAHQIGWRDVIQCGLGHKPIYLMAIDKSGVRGILPLFQVITWWRARYLISIPWLDYGGVLSDSVEIDNMLLEAAIKIAKERNAHFIELRSEQRHSPNLSCRTDKATFLLTLDKNHDSIWKGFNAKLRNQVRKAGKSGLDTEIGGIELLQEFYRIFSWKMRDLGTPVWGYPFFYQLMKKFSNSQIILVKIDNAYIASGLIMKFRKRLYVPSAASFRKYLKYCPNHALYWTTIKQGCIDGFTHFDFGRSTLDSNTYNFKKQWVPNPTILNWQYYLNRIHEIPSLSPQNRKYSYFIKLWRLLPLTVANYLGPKVIRNFP